jgi:hypothetical protein
MFPPAVRIELKQPPNDRLLPGSQIECLAGKRTLDVLELINEFDLAGRRKRRPPLSLLLYCSCTRAAGAVPGIGPPCFEHMTAHFF